MKLFYCYSPKLKKFLLENGERYLHYSTHKKTKRDFWVFEGNQTLNQLLEEWNQG